MKFNLKDNRFIKHKIKSCNEKEVNDLENIKVTILSAPSYEEVCKYIPELATATWNENIEEFRQTLNREDKNEIMKLCFEGKLIPTCLESIHITLLLEGITTHDVTHFLRHNGLFFAADCTGDKYITNRNLIIPSFLEDCPKEYKERYIALMKDSYNLYDDICNNLQDKVHIQDARLVLPRTLETFYYITGSLNTFIRFLNQRIDMQVQPKSDNIIALKIYEALSKIYPIKYNIHKKNEFYCKESTHNLSSKWYNPLPQNETEYTLKINTVYGDMSQMYGYNKYKKLEKEIEEKINEKSNNRY